MDGKALPRRRALADMAGRQHGVVSIRQLRSLGFSHASVERSAQSGQLHRLHQGVYAVGHTNLSLQGHCLAAVLASGSGALLSHYSAGWLLGLTKARPIPVHVTTPSPRKPRGSLRIHHSRTLTEADRLLEQRVPVTSAARTALDLAACVRFRSLRRLIQRAEELGSFDLAAFCSVIARNRSHRGAVPLRRALDTYEPPRFTRSDLERFFVELVEGAGFPAPATNFVEAGYELDVYWPELRFAVEVDVFETHGTRDSFESDRLRQEDLKLAGIELVRVTGRRLESEPEQVLERTGRLLAQRERELRALSRRPARGAR